MRAMFLGRAGSVTSTIERPVESPVRANRRPPAVVYPQLPAAERAATAAAPAACPDPGWLRAARSRGARSAMFAAPVDDEGDGDATADGAPDSEPHPARAAVRTR